MVLEVLSAGSHQVRQVTLIRQKILQSGPAPLESRQSRSIRNTLSDGAQKAVKHLQKFAQAAAAAAESMQIREEEEEIDQEAQDIVNRMQISAPFNYQVNMAML